MGHDTNAEFRKSVLPDLLVIDMGPMVHKDHVNSGSYFFPAPGNCFKRWHKHDTAHISPHNVSYTELHLVTTHHSHTFLSLCLIQISLNQ